MVASALVSVEAVTKRYRGGRGIEDLSLEVEEGEVFAFLGPNGAGKTTTIRVLLDLIRPDAGVVKLFGLELRRHSVELRRRIGYLPGDLALYGHLTARELLSHFAYLRRGPAWSEIADLADAFALELDAPIKALSKGNRQKVGIVQALMGKPPLLILDEPTSGLDPLVQSQVHRLVRAAAAEGRTVFLSSHVLSEVGQVADRVGIIKDGRMVGTRAVCDLKGGAVHYVDVRFAGGIVPSDLAALPGVVVGPVPGAVVHLTVKGDLDPLIAVLAAHSIEDLAIREPHLEDVFIELLAPDEGEERVGAISGATDGRA